MNTSWYLLVLIVSFYHVCISFLNVSFLNVMFVTFLCGYAGGYAFTGRIDLFTIMSYTLQEQFCIDDGGRGLALTNGVET